VICDINRCASAPSSTSRTMARPTTMPAPAVMPCIMRKNSRLSMLQARAHPTEAAKNRASAQSVTRRRPHVSENAPCQSASRANGAMYAVNVCCTSNGDAENTRPISGIDGR
jgi:hypothetical protein